MMSYAIQFRPAVEKDLKPLPKTIILRAIRGIIALQKNPVPETAVKLSGVENFYRIRIGDYRIIYEIDRESSTIIVHYIRHRRDVYRNI